jgi:hypothetical protein
MIKNSFYLFFLFVFSFSAIAQSIESNGTKYILDGNDSFSYPFFTSSNTLYLYNALNMSQYLKFISAPSTPTSPGLTGQMAYEDNFLYICVGANSWRRVRMGTW